MKTESSTHTYLDYNASAPLREEARRAMEVGLRELVGNASSVHWAGRHARAELERARGDVAALIGCEPTEIVFTSGGTEANNLAIRGVCNAQPGAHVVTTAVEHASVLETCRALAARGCGVTCVGVDQHGRVDPWAVAAAVRPETTLVSVGLANNEVGTVQPIAEIRAALGSRPVVLHVDAVQAAGKIPVAVNALGADVLSVSAHKLGGPQGIGALYVRRGVSPSVQQSGGPQELGRRAGTENVLAALGFGEAARAATRELAAETLRLQALIARLWRGISARVPDAERNSPVEGVVPNTLNVSVPGASAEGLIIGLDLDGVAVSAGSACAAGSLEPSHVLLAMGRSPAAARSALRISIGHATREDDVDVLVRALPRVVARCRHALGHEAR
jgi:cysteine desulfurase